MFYCRFPSFFFPPPISPPLRVFVQVNTSGEESKYGLEPGAPVVELARYVRDACPRLQLAGLMTIGMPDYSSRPENFECLARCRGEVAAALGVPEASLELSMGMSGDFEQAIEMGSTNVRVGSTIFGARDYGNKEQK
jgi:PLP dependent protein